jgi:diacylglycerol kinase family enzyme
VRVALIVNPFATRVDEPLVREVERILARSADVETRLTERPGHAVSLAAAARAADADAVVAFGGDGVANEVLNGLGTGAVFAPLPGGGTNVLARALGLPRDPEDAAGAVARALAAGRTRPITLGRVAGRRFAFAAAVGLAASVVRRVDALGRSSDGRRPGDLAFVGQLTRQLAAERFRIATAFDVLGLGRGAAAFVANCDPFTYAGAVALHVAPLARFELGLDLVAPTRVTPRTLIRHVGYAVRGKGLESAGDVLTVHDVDRIEIVCDRPLPLQVDGEDLGDVEQAVFEAERAAVEVPAACAGAEDGAAAAPDP